MMTNMIIKRTKQEELTEECPCLFFVVCDEKRKRKEREGRRKRQNRKKKIMMKRERVKKRERREKRG